MFDPAQLWSFFSHGIGCIVLCKIIFEFFRFVWICFLRPGKNLKKSYGEWAVVTGATDGIGKAMALELARKGQKVLLVSRSPEKLAETAAEFKDTEVDTLALDFSGPFTEEKQKAVQAKIQGREIGVLVNNVGISYDTAAFFLELDDDRMEKLVDVNDKSTVWMCKLVMPGMVERKKGCVVNISSGASQAIAPLYAEYSAAKQFVNSFSENLDSEYASKGVRVQVQWPMYVTTKLAKLRHTALTIPSPKGYARAAVSAIGYERALSPYWSHYLYVGFLRVAPVWLLEPIVMGLHLGIRKKALAKKAAKKE